MLGGRFGANDPAKLVVASPGAETVGDDEMMQASNFCSGAAMLPKREIVFLVIGQPLSLWLIEIASAN